MYIPEIDLDKYSPFARELEELAFINLANSHRITKDTLFEILSLSIIQSSSRFIKSITAAKARLNQYGPQIDDASLEELYKIVSILLVSSDSLPKILHRLGRHNYKTAFADFANSLNKSEYCQKMISKNKIDFYESNVKEIKVATNLTSKALELIKHCETVFPVFGGYNASIIQSIEMPIIPIISLFHGVAECFTFISKVLLFYTSEGDGDIGIRHKRDSNIELAFNDILIALEIVRGTKLAVPMPAYEEQFNVAQSVWATQFYSGAMDFVYFHEFAHLLTEEADDKQEVEFKCDEFAIRLAASTFNEVQMHGILIALLVASILSTSIREYTSNSHPHPALRYNRAIQLVGSQELFRFNNAKMNFASDVISPLLALVQRRI